MPTAAVEPKTVAIITDKKASNNVFPRAESTALFLKSSVYQ